MHGSIDEDKFKSNENEFKDRDTIVISNKTFDQVIKLTDKPVHKIPFGLIRIYESKTRIAEKSIM